MTADEVRKHLDRVANVFSIFHFALGVAPEEDCKIQTHDIIQEFLDHGPQDTPMMPSEIITEVVRRQCEFYLRCLDERNGNA